VVARNLQNLINYKLYKKAVRQAVFRFLEICKRTGFRCGSVSLLRF